MIIIPAIDMISGKPVRLYQGDYAKSEVVAESVLDTALSFEKAGASYIHMVDLEGARDGGTPNLPVVEQVARETGLFVEVGGGVRSMETIARYFAAGADRVILGAAAVSDEALLREAAAKFGEKIAVGADVRDGFIAIKGWLEKSELSLAAFLEKMQSIGIKTVICTDISRDGAMQGTNLELYARLNACYDMQIVASGGVSSLEDLRKLKEIGLFGAIIGKAYYTGAIDLREALEVSA